MKRYIATLVLAGALLCPSFAFASAVPANAVPLPDKKAIQNFPQPTYGYGAMFVLMYLAAILRMA